MKVLIVYAGMLMKSGGMQHICCEMANAFAGKGYETAIACGGGDLTSSFFPLDKGIKIYSLIADRPVNDMDKAVVGRKISTGDKLVREIIRAFSKRKFHEWNERCKCKVVKPYLKKVLHDFRPDVIVGYNSDAVYYTVASMDIPIPIIGTNHSELSRAFAEMGQPEIDALNRCAALQVLLPSQKEILEKHCPHVPCVVIPNVVSESKKISSLEQQTVLFVGRLTKAAKRPHLAIRAFQKAVVHHPDWKLEIWGDGHGAEHYVDEMKKDIASHHMEDHILFKGTTTDIQSVYCHASILICPSQHEGWGLAVTEAMSAGLPVVAFKSCAGVNELVEDGYSGFLTEDDTSSMANALEKLMESDTLRKEMGINARHSMENFSEEKVWNSWFHLLEKVTVSNHQGKSNIFEALSV